MEAVISSKWSLLHFVTIRGSSYTLFFARISHEELLSYLEKNNCDNDANKLCCVISFSIQIIPRYFLVLEIYRTLTMDINTFQTTPGASFCVFATNWSHNVIQFQHNLAHWSGENRTKCKCLWCSCSFHHSFKLETLFETVTNFLYLS